MASASFYPSSLPLSAPHFHLPHAAAATGVSLLALTHHVHLRLTAFTLHLGLFLPQICAWLGPPHSLDFNKNVTCSGKPSLAVCSGLRNVSPQIHVYLEPLDVTFSGKRVIAVVI